MNPLDIATLTEGSPRITRVTDLGSPHIGKPGPIVTPAPDGRFVVGELVLIEGRGFGKRPTVLIGGKPADLRWRVEGGGLIAQIPSGLGAGPQTLVVEAAGQRAEHNLHIHRLAAVLDGTRGLLLTLLVGGGGGEQPHVKPWGQPLLLPGAFALAVSHDGAAAYVLLSRADHHEVAIVDLTEAHGPRIRAQLPLRHRVLGLASAALAPALVLVGESQLTLWDTTEPNRPTPWPAVPLPLQTAPGSLFSLHPNGTLLSVGFPEQNEVVLLDVRAQKTTVTVKEAGRANVWPQATAPLLSALRFSPDGRQLWALLGDREPHRVKDSKFHFTRLAKLSVSAPGDDGVGRTLLAHEPFEARDIGPPLSLSVGRNRPAGSGAAIRDQAEEAFVVFAAAGTGATPAGLFRLSEGGELKTISQEGPRFVGLDLDPSAGLAVAAEVLKVGSLSVTAFDTRVRSSASFLLHGAPAENDSKNRIEVMVQP